MTLEILDAGGAVVRTYATDPDEAGDEDFSELAAPAAGLNRHAWDFRAEGLPTVPGLMTYGSTDGRMMPPGEYQARLTHGDEFQSVRFSVEPDPRRTATMAQYAEQDRFVASAQGVVRDLFESVLVLQSVRDQVDAVVETTADHEAADTVAAVGGALTEKITGLEDQLIQTRQKTFQDVINFLNQLDAQILHLIGTVDGTEPPVTQGAQERLADLTGEWGAHSVTRDTILDEDLVAFEQLLADLGIPHVVIRRAPSENRPITQEDGADRR